MNNDLNNNENKSLFDGNPNDLNKVNPDQITPVTPEVNNTPSVEPTVVNPVIDRVDLADKTINAVENFVDTKDHKDEYTKDEIKMFKTSATISYIPLVCLYFIATSKHKKSPYLLFHVNQGFNITAITVCIFILNKIINLIFNHGSLVLNSTPAFIEITIYTLYFLCFLLILFGMSNTMNGLSKELPVVGKFKFIK